MNGIDRERSNPERVAENRAALDLPAVQRMLAVMETENILPTVIAEAPEIASVRNYHEAIGRQDWLFTFRSFGVSLAAQPEAEEPTYDPPPETTNP